MPQLRDPLDTPRKNEIRGGMWVADLAAEKHGLVDGDEALAEFFKVHLDTVDYIRNDDEDRCNDAERAGTATNEVKRKCAMQECSSSREREKRRKLEVGGRSEKGVPNEGSR